VRSRRSVAWRTVISVTKLVFFVDAGSGAEENRVNPQSKYQGLTGLEPAVSCKRNVSITTTPQCTVNFTTLVTILLINLCRLCHHDVGQNALSFRG
jgi:hypothetical protein